MADIDKTTEPIRDPERGRRGQVPDRLVLKRGARPGAAQVFKDLLDRVSSVPARSVAARKPTTTQNYLKGARPVDIDQMASYVAADVLGQPGAELLRILVKKVAMLEDRVDAQQDEIVALKIRAGQPVDADEAFRHFGIDPEDLEPLTADDISFS